MLEAESEGEARRTAAAVPSPGLAVPASLHASLMARLDRLGPAKEVAQVGAAIGREFSHTLLAAVMRKPEAELQFGARPSHCRRFAVPARRAAACDLPVQACPGAGRRLWHAAARAASRASCPHRRNASKTSSLDIAENQPELLARHCTEAGLIEKAVGLWGKAGQRSMERSALLEAVEQFKRALDQIATLPSTPALRRMQINLQVALITPLNTSMDGLRRKPKRRWSGHVCCSNKLKRSASLSKTRCCCSRSSIGVWSANFVAFNGDSSRDLAAQMLALAEKQKACFITAA